MSEDRAGGWIAFLIAAIAISACVLALCGCDTAEANTIKSANGMPLDAISYDPPEWMPNCCKVYRFYDRASGQQWWVMEMGNGYVVLPCR